MHPAHRLAGPRSAAGGELILCGGCHKHRGNFNANTAHSPPAWQLTGDLLGEMQATESMRFQY
jgi:cytochrome c553